MARLTEGRRRRITTRGNRVRVFTGFFNPYPYMSGAEAMLKIELDHMRVPYSWRFFDGEAPTLKALVPDFAPEFTLREYKFVIIMLGGFFGTLPGILDKTALAKVGLEHDGWRVAILFEAEVLRNPRVAILKYLPELAAPTIRGGERPNPYGAPQLFEKKLQRLRATGLHKTRFIYQDKPSTDRRDDADSRRGRRRRRRRRAFGGGVGYRFRDS